MAPFRAPDAPVVRRPAIAALLAALLALTGLVMATSAAPASAATDSCGHTMTFNSAAIHDVVVDEAFTATVWASGGASPYTFSVDGGAPPPGMTFSTSGTFSGTPTTLGTYQMSVRATDANGCFLSSGMKTVRVVTSACYQLRYSWTGDSSATELQAYKATYTASYGTAPYTWALTGGALPPGLKLTTTDTSATISGTPTKQGTYSYQLTLTDSTPSVPCSTTIDDSIKVDSPTTPTTNQLNQALAPVTSLVQYVQAGCLQQLVQVVLGQLPKVSCP